MPLALVIVASGLRFIVKKKCLRNVHIKQSTSPQSQAEINVIVCDCKLLIKPAQLIKKLFFYHKTRTCHCRIVLHMMNTVTVSVFNKTYPRIRMNRRSVRTYSDYDTRMLHSLIRIEQTCTDRTCIISHSVFCHSPQRIRLNNLRVIV